MEWFVLFVVAGGAAWGGRRLGARRALRRERDEELEAVRRLVDEDITVFGEQLRRLDARVGERLLDDDGRADYQRALDAYETAQRAVPRLREPDEVSTVTDTLASGRHALACVEARAAGLRPPDHRSPCFFNPQHGPSVTDVVWTSSRYGTRTVPACAQDAARLAAHQQPELRTVTIGARTMPYWQAGAVFLPYSRGYFASAAALHAGGAGVEWAFTTPEPWAGGHAGHGGHGPGGDLGGGDGGGDGGGW